MPELPEGALVIEPAKDGSGFYWAAKWRLDGHQRKLRLGRANLVARKTPLEPSEGEEISAWERRYVSSKGRPTFAYLKPEEAKTKMRQAIKDHAEQMALPPDHRVMTFGKVADSWLAERAADVKDHNLKASTLKDYASMLRRADDPLQRRGRGRTAHIMRAFEDRPVASITGEEVDAFGRKLQAAGLSVQTRKKYDVLASMILQHAVDRGHMKINPSTARPKAKRKRTRKPAVQVYSLDVVEQIAQHAGGQVGETIRLAALSGLRQGELLALRWADVDFIGQAIRVRRTYVAGSGEDVPKSGSARSVSLSDQAGAVLDRVSRRERWTKQADLVFPNEQGTHTDASTLRRAYMLARDAVIEQGDDLPSLRFHDLRHSFGSRCASAGVPLATIRELMGHADISTTMIYVHWQPHADDAARLTAAFGGTAEQAKQTAVSI